MRKHGHGEQLDVVRKHEVATLEQRPCLRRPLQVDARAHARGQHHVGAGADRLQQRHEVAADGGRGNHAQARFLELDHLVDVDHSAKLRDGVTVLAPGQNLERLGVRGRAHLGSQDEALFGTQVHSGDSSRGLSPSFSLVSYGRSGGRTFQVFRTSSTSTSPSTSNQVIYRYPEIPIRFGQWVDFVFKFREAIDNTGLLQVWMDGNQIVDYQGGPLGFNTPGYKDYAKFGYYNWSSFDSSRKVLIKSPLLVSDPTGSKYQASALRAFVNASE